MTEHRKLLWLSCVYWQGRRLSTAGLLLAVVTLCLLTLVACNSRRANTTPAIATTSSPSPSALNPKPADTGAGGEGKSLGNSSYGWTTSGARRMKLADYLGQVVVLDFYATWCAPCREETPHLVALHKRYAPQGFQVVGLNVGGPDDRDEVAGFAQEFGIQYPLGFPDAEFTEAYLSDNDSIPQALVFDRRGHLAKRFIGYDETIPAELERVVQSALGPGSD
ncbi:MAG: redoxin domain-containing protein [Pyrinomonadaceae bacterium]